VHPAYFDGAPRYRSGGLVGLAPDDVPIIAHRGEEVLTETNPRHRRNVDRMPGRGPTIQLVIPDATPEKIAQSRGQLARTMAIAQKMAQRHN
jgi:hypothetical protein